MKRILSVLLCITCLTACISCAKKAPRVNEIVDKEEAQLYNDIIIGQNSSYDNTEMTKRGIFTILYDTFNDVERYYVWGYASDELDSGWQWEFTVSDPDALPAIGSQITVTGKLVVSDSALDKKWIENASVTVESEYEDALCKYDLTTMSPILSARVQIPNIMNNPSEFADGSIAVYGKVAAASTLTSPYDELSWTLPVSYEKELPEEGSYITAVGNYDDHGHFLIEKIFTK